LARPARERNATAKSGPVSRHLVTLASRVFGRSAGKALDTLVGVPRPARRVFMMTGVLVALVGLVLAACSANPPPAPQSTDTPHNSPPPPQRVSQIIMGIDSIGAGFNPHLLSDLSPSARWCYPARFGRCPTRIRRPVRAGRWTRRCWCPPM
jgi:hypothetical protein